MINADTIRHAQQRHEGMSMNASCWPQLRSINTPRFCCQNINRTNYVSVAFLRKSKSTLKNPILWKSLETS
eukprot:5624163-Amphidinium_carterae.1